MKKINSIHYGGRILFSSLICGILFPALLWLVGKGLRWELLFVAAKIFCVIGLLIFVGFFVFLKIELTQDKKIDRYYSMHKNRKIAKENGRYECAACGNWQVSSDDTHCRICGIHFAESKDLSPQEILDMKKGGKG